MRTALIELLSIALVAIAFALPAFAQTLDVPTAVATFQDVRPITNQVYVRADGWEGKLDLYARQSRPRKLFNGPVAASICGG